MNVDRFTIRAETLDGNAGLWASSNSIMELLEIIRKWMIDEELMYIDIKQPMIFNEYGRRLGTLCVSKSLWVLTPALKYRVFKRRR